MKFSSICDFTDNIISLNATTKFMHTSHIEDVVNSEENWGWIVL